MRLVFGLMLVSSLLAPASAEERGRVYRVAVLSPGSVEAIIRVTLPELAKLGFIEGTNLSLTTRSGVPIPEFPAVARELVEKEPDLLVGVSSSAVKALLPSPIAFPSGSGSCFFTSASGLPAGMWASYSSDRWRCRCC